MTHPTTHVCCVIWTLSYVFAVNAAHTSKVTMVWTLICGMLWNENRLIKDDLVQFSSGWHLSIGKIHIHSPLSPGSFPSATFEKGCLSTSLSPCLVSSRAASKRSGKSACAPPFLPEVSPVQPLKKAVVCLLHQWPCLVTSRSAVVDRSCGPETEVFLLSTKQTKSHVSTDFGRQL